MNCLVHKSCNQNFSSLKTIDMYYGNYPFSIGQSAKNAKGSGTRVVGPKSRAKTRSSERFGMDRWEPGHNSWERKIGVAFSQASLIYPCIPWRPFLVALFIYGGPRAFNSKDHVLLTTSHSLNYIQVKSMWIWTNYCIDIATRFPRALRSGSYHFLEICYDCYYEFSVEIFCYCSRYKRILINGFPASDWYLLWTTPSLPTTTALTTIHHWDMSVMLKMDLLYVISTRQPLNSGADIFFMMMVGLTTKITDIVTPQSVPTSAYVFSGI